MVHVYFSWLISLLSIRLPAFINMWVKLGPALRLPSNKASVNWRGNLALLHLDWQLFSQTRFLCHKVPDFPTCSYWGSIWLPGWSLSLCLFVSTLYFRPASSHLTVSLNTHVHTCSWLIDVCANAFLLFLNNTSHE